jgi:hypothetical protein
VADHTGNMVCSTADHTVCTCYLAAQRCCDCSTCSRIYMCAL